MHFNEKPRCDEATSWTLAGLWLLLIYVTIPLARTIQEFIRDHGGKIIFLWVTFAVFGLAALWVIRAVRRKELVISPLRAVLLFIILALFSWLAWTLRANPEEAIHFVQYGVLSMLVYRALSHRINDYSIYFAATMIGAGFGIVDELIQWVVPKRFFDFRDIGINVAAVVLIQLAVAAGIRPAIIRGRPGSTGLRIGFSSMLLNLLMLLFCISNTPSFQKFYGTYFPAIAKIKDMTVEYGYMYQDPDIGSFKSRLSPDELARQDRELYAEVVPKLNEYRTDRQYLYFISKAKAYEKPLLVEARIHIFRRDRYAKTSRDAQNDDQLKRSAAAIAFQENRILEKYFPNVLNHSRYVWPTEARQRYAELSRGVPLQASQVSAGIVTRTSQRELTAILAVLILISLTGLTRTFRRKNV